MRRWLLLVVVGLPTLAGLVWGWRFFGRASEQLTADLVRPRNRPRPGREFPFPPEGAWHLRVEGMPRTEANGPELPDPDGPGVWLDTWVIDPAEHAEESAVQSVLVLHGIGDHKGTMLGLGRRYARAGVRAILVDLCGHGRSTVAPISYGTRERHDLMRVLDAIDLRLRERGESLGSVGVYGPSYGGANALQLAAHDDRVTRVFTVAAFADLRTLAGPYLAHSWGGAATMLPGWWIEQMVASAGRRTAFDPAEASAVRAAETIASREVDVVLVHSRDDEIVPFAHAEAIAAACGSRCRLVTITGHDHLGSMSNQVVREESYRQIVGREFPN